MRLQNLNSDKNSIELKAFSYWILSIEDGTIGGLNDGHATIEIHDDLLINETVNSMQQLWKARILISQKMLMTHHICKKE